MPLTPQQLLSHLEGLGIVTRTIEHPPLFTVSQSRELRGELRGGHTKNLFVKDKKGRFFLVSCREDANVDLNRLHVRLGASGRLSFGSVARMAGRPRGASLAFRGGLASEQIRAGGVGLAPLMTATLCYFFATFPRNHKS